MRAQRDVPTILGILAVAGTLLLLSPGVRVVRADDAPRSASPPASSDGPTCEAGPVTGGEEIVEYLRHVQRLQVERMAASPDAADDSDGFIVLNNRGYNYGPAGFALPQSIELEHR